MRNRARCRPLAAVLCTALAAATLGADEIDEYVAAEMRARRIPGLALAVVQAGQIVRTGYYGQANVELEVPVSERSVFPIASLDKELTAAGIMRLVEKGRVSLEDPVTKHLEGPWRGIRIRHLLTHTSGLPDEVAASVEGRLLTSYTTEQLLATVRNLSSVAPPGERYEYSDANFFLAQLVTQRVSGEPWRPFITREVVAPAGAKGATFLDPEEVRPGRVAPYTLDDEGRLRRDPLRDVDFGPLYNDLGMTVRDFAAWLLALDDNRVLARASREAMWTPASLGHGLPVAVVGQWRGYGLGFGLDEVFGHRVVTHSGYTGVAFVKLPEDSLSVVVFTNLRHSTGSDPIGLAYGIAGSYVPEVSWRHRTVVVDTNPPATALMRGEYERLLAGAPDLDRWSPPVRTAAWDAGASLPFRARRFGKLLSFEPLAREAGGGEERLLFRARHENGRVFLRFTLAPDGRIAGLQWYHV